MLTFRKILVPVDDSEHSRRAFEYALGLAKTQGAYVELLHCYGRIPMLVGGQEREGIKAACVAEAEKLLAPYAERLRGQGQEPSLLIKEGKPGEVVAREAEAGGFDLIVMGTRGLSDLAGMLLGSTAHRVLSSAKCPVLLIR